MGWDQMDQALAEYSAKLLEIGIAEKHLNCLASAMRSELIGLDPRILKDKFTLVYPDAASINDQIVYNLTFIESYIEQIHNDDAFNQTAVLVNNYLYFVYTQDTLLQSVKTASPRKGPSRIIATFLTEHRVRDFRNAFAHGKWRYVDGTAEYKNIEYAVEKGENRTFEILDTPTLRLWHLLSKTLLGLWSARIADLRQPLNSETSA